ncbi:unnamed protein product [Lathyrus sativus]|nr:unnamed protein product [Lathyrus sativus]
MEHSNIPENAGNGRINFDSSMLASEDLLDLCLFRYLLTNKPIRFNAMKDMLSQLWQPGYSYFKDGGEQFLVQYFHFWDMERAYQGGRWLIKNYMLVLRELKFGEEPLTVRGHGKSVSRRALMNEAEIWIQIHQLSFGFICENVAILIRNHMGKFISYNEQNNYGTWIKYMRIRVAINVQELLKGAGPLIE